MMGRRAFLAGSVGLVGCRPRPSATEAPAPRPTPLPDGFHRGMNLAHLHERGWGYGSDRARAQLDALYAMGVRDIALNPFAYVSSTSATELRWGGDATLTTDDLRTAVRDAHDRGMRVMMKPHVWSRSFLAGAGNPDIRMDAASWTAWFASYTRWAVHNATIAAETGCEWLCVGLEFTGATLANPGAWARVAEACRAVYRGKLLYAANWYEEGARFTDWDAFDAIGIDAYFPLAGDSVDALAASWAPHLDAIAAYAGGRPVIFAEAGYRALAGATAEPWDGRGGAEDPALQARAYEALLRACTARPWFQGVYWWKWFTDPTGEPAAYGIGGAVDPFVPTEPARRVLEAWFR